MKLEVPLTLKVFTLTSNVKPSINLTAYITIKHYGGGGAYSAAYLKLYINNKLFYSGNSMYHVEMVDINQSDTKSFNIGTYSV